jgi:hypothetical protein
MVAPVLSQEGHPMTGTWSGDWGPSASHRNQITLILQWDGKAVTGIADPGPDSIPVKVTLDSTKWMVRIEADAKGRGGKPVHFVAEGKLENICSYHRTITGTWNHDNVKGDFKITRD